jgi:hypothetical protein
MPGGLVRAIAPAALSFIMEGEGSDAMASVKTSKVNPKYKRKYHVRNWAAYERGLCDRGDVTVWLSQEAIEAWTPPPTGCRGGQPRYSSLAIITALTLRVVFRLPLRQTEGFLASLLRLMELDLDAPDHTTLSRRNQTVEVPAFRRDHAGPIHLIVDSTGLKIFGAGEWNSRKHREAKDRRGWRKLHLGVDGDGFIVAEALTKNTKDDAAVLPDLLGQIEGPIRRFTGDGAYDRKSVYDQIGRAGIEDVAVVVPPRRPAALTTNASGTWAQRNRHLERIAEVGRQAWQKEVRYRQQARVEGTFRRYKRTLGDHLRARGFDAQKREAAIGCAVLDRMLKLGRPESYAIAA